MIDTMTSNEQLEHQRLTSLINSMADAVVAVDNAGKILLYNAALLNILDINTITIGTDLAKLFKPLDKEDHPAKVLTMISQADVPTTSRDLRLKYADDSYINLYISIAPVHLGYGNKDHNGYVMLLRDITREKSLEEERDEFISVVSHELRTPISIAEGNISNAQYTANKTGDISTVKQALQEAHTQVLFLEEMINDLSTLSRAEGGKLNLEVVEIDTPKLASELSKTYLPQAHAKGLNLRTVIADNLKPLHSSELYVREILQNFITNAIKYCDKGSVTLKATATSNGVRFDIHDTGIGISKSDQARVYDKFFRSEDYRTRKANGTGLGLYITMKLARLVQAELNLESELNKGSTFTIIFPNMESPA